MRAVFVNHCHPDCSHICATRAREFARAFAQLGHQIVLVTETLQPGDPEPDPGFLPTALKTHDWSEPFMLACPPVPSPVLEKLRAGQLPRLVSKTVVVLHYLVFGGVFTDWRAGTRPYWRPLASAFAPEVVWGIFGNTDAWAIAQGIAHEAHCPWVRDIKDQWTAFIPSPLRGMLARRFADADATTALSLANAADAAPWFGPETTVVYSGYPADIDRLVTTASPPEKTFSLALVGAVYEPALLAELVAGIEAFLDKRERGAVRLVYAGTDAKTVEEAFAPLRSRLHVEIFGQLPLARFSDLLCNAHANLYVRMPKNGWWHHKIVELLAAQRPIVCYPGEIDEAKRLAETVKGRLENPATPEALANVLDTLWQNRGEFGLRSDPAAIATLGWEYQAERLLGAFPGIA